MTDVPGPGLFVPSRLGLGARLEGDEVRFELVTQPEACVHGVVRASVVSLVVDVAAGVLVDDDPDWWSLTSDMTVRMRAVAAPPLVTAVTTVLRRGGRGISCRVDLTADAGAPFAVGAIGFAKIARREGDPPKPVFDAQRAASMFEGVPALSRPLREEAGIEVVDPANGVVELLVTPELRNPVGTLQGAMVALVAEAAAEELTSARAGAPMVVTDLDLRYLAQAPVGPVRTRARLLGDRPGDPVEVELIDTSVDRLTTLVYARAVPAPPSP